MSIRMLAIELYRVKREIEGLERELKGLKPDSQGRSELEKKLVEARAEHARLKKMLDGAKES
jgi:hypothetical protein